MPLHRHERVVPSGTLELVVNLAEDEIRIHDAVHPSRVRRYSGAVVSGAFSGFFGIDTREHESILGVHFKPAGAFPFLGIPADELADKHVDLETLWGSSARILRERLCTATTPTDRFRILEDALCDRLRHRVRRHPIVPYALAQLERPESSVADVAERSNLSHRRFIEVFRAEVGMTPKLFGRVRRFERAAAFVRHAPPTDWAELALSCGYYDQSHMIGDFVAFSGFTPLEFLRQASPEVKDGHVLA
jgi:AraC-like DNA-binding protein